MNYRAITVSREFGSGGADIARLLAERLGWNLLDHALVDEIARAAHVDPALARRYDEQVDGWLHRVLRQGIWSGAFEAVAPPAETQVFDAATEVQIAAAVIREAHQQGHCVIVGRGSQCVLRGLDDVFRIFVYAPLARRIERVRQRADAPRDVEAWIHSTDLLRARAVRQYYGCDWVNPHLYHLLIDSSVGIDAAVDAVLAAMRAGDR